MKDYFDEDFFKLLFGFIAIVSISIIFVFATKAYSNNLDLQRAEIRNNP